MGWIGNRREESETAWIMELADWFKRRGISPLDTATQGAYFSGFILGMTVEQDKPRAQLTDPKVQVLVTIAQNTIAEAFFAGQFAMRASRGQLTTEDVRAAQERTHTPGKP